MMDEKQLIAYRAAREGAAFAEVTDPAWVRLTGRDRLDLPHRLSTNALKHLKPGEGAPTVFASATGRVMAFVTAYAGEDEAFLRTTPGQGAGVTRYIKSMIFWQDQVEAADLSGETAQLTLYGPGATGLLRALGAAGVLDCEPYGWRAASIAGTAASIHRGGPLEPFQWLLVVPLGQRAPLDALAASAPKLDDDTSDLLRIEAGLPLWRRELSEQVTPLESGLLPAVHFNKGCYTGQEVIARQTNYDKVTRNLVGLELPLPSDSPLLTMRGGDTSDTSEPLAVVRGPGRGGLVGSIAYSPALDKVIALAIVPRELAQPGTEVEVVFETHSVKGTVRSLPFITNHAD